MISMSNYVWVCFDCQSAVRRPALTRDVTCATCQKACVCLGAKIAIPPKSKSKLWESLRQGFYLARVERRTAAEKRRIRRIHNLEQKITRLDSLPENPGRARAVTELKHKLEQERA